MESRRFDVIIYGASGYTGKLVTEYFLKHVKDTKWAIAGRDKAKLERTAGDMAASIPIVIASTDDSDALMEMAKQTVVLINCVGPFVLYGESVVRACIDTHTHYVDITGEPAFMNKVQRVFGKAAEEARVLVVSACGFDSVPADMGAYFTEEFFETERDVPVDIKASVFFSSLGLGSLSGMSNGTFTTFLTSFQQADEAKRRQKQKEKEDAAAAKGEGEKSRADARKKKPSNPPTWHFDKERKRYLVPMYVADPFVVRRSAQLLGGRKVKYTHYFESKNLWSFVWVIILFDYLMMMLVRYELGRRILSWFKTEGSGPSEEERKHSSFTMTFQAKGVLKRTQEEGALVTQCHGPEAYDATAICVGQAALAIVHDFDRLPAHAGVLTPAAALGRPYLERLNKENVTFKVTRK
eukprot:TRINITY_DN81564_c0_g1_i1.p1 TRINITY_DN81564_c0_g1~~TRINITY_DN81564_c0_g1_i1.p1  ORF type:complete len:410 (+),score=107.68 TRINITY_DN81564_c0_g1_i1:142-1371(+)